MNSSAAKNASVEVMAGGKKSRSQKTVSSGKKQQQQQQKKGGAVVDDIKNLAVPFAILLAKQGIQSLFDKKSSESVGISASPKKSVKSKSSSRKQEGGSCVTCQGKTAGGAAPSKQGRTTSLKKNYVSLAKKIDEFLSKY